MGQLSHLMFLLLAVAPSEVSSLLQFICFRFFRFQVPLSAQPPSSWGCNCWPKSEVWSNDHIFNFIQVLPIIPETQEMLLNKLQDSLNPQPKGEIFIIYIFLKFRIWKGRDGSGENRDNETWVLLSREESKVSILPLSTCCVFLPFFFFPTLPIFPYNSSCLSTPEGQELLVMKHVLNLKARGVWEKCLSEPPVPTNMLSITSHMQQHGFKSR